MNNIIGKSSEGKEVLHVAAALKAEVAMRCTGRILEVYLGGGPIFWSHWMESEHWRLSGSCVFMFGDFGLFAIIVNLKNTPL